MPRSSWNPWKLWERDLAEIWGWLRKGSTCHLDHSDKHSPAARNSSEAYMLQLRIPSAFALTQNLLGGWGRGVALCVDEGEMARNKNDISTNMLGEAAQIISQPITWKVKILSSSSCLFNTGTVQKREACQRISLKYLSIS